MRKARNYLSGRSLNVLKIRLKTLTHKLGTLLDKTEKFMVHIKYLKLAIDAEYKPSKVHEHFQFAQDFVYKQYIDGNNQKKRSKDFAENRNKDLSNIIYGKNILKQRDYEIFMYQITIQQQD